MRNISRTPSALRPPFSALRLYVKNRLVIKQTKLAFPVLPRKFTKDISLRFKTAHQAAGDQSPAVDKHEKYQLEGQ